MHTRQETRNLELKSITDKNGPVPIWFEFGDRETLMPLVAVWTCVPRWNPVAGPQIYARHPKQLLQKILQWQEGCLKKSIRIPMESSATREYPSLLHTFFLTHTVRGVFLNPEDKALYFEHFIFLEVLENSFEVLKLLENSVEVLKILENKLESMRILKNKLESLKLQENQPVFGGSIWRDVLAGVFGGSIGLQEEFVKILDQDLVWELVHFGSLTKSSPKGMRS
ncbi:hypothetical protein Tco_1568924 [Tanacetum coccineum]